MMLYKATIPSAEIFIDEAGIKLVPADAHDIAKVKQWYESAGADLPQRDLSRARLLVSDCDGEVLQSGDVIIFKNDTLLIEYVWSTSSRDGKPYELDAIVSVSEPTRVGGGTFTRKG